MPDALNKTNQFYELILHDSKSVELKHNIDPKDDTNITHSTWQIEKVLSLSDWKKNPFEIKKFSKPFDPMGYNYWDY